MRKALFLLILLFSALFQVIHAEPIDSLTARHLAANFYSQIGSTPSQREAGRIVKTVSSAITDSVLHSSRNVVCYYIVNFSDGFVIISADDRVEPVLAYSTESIFDADNIPENTAAWLDNYRQEISYALSHDFAASDNVSNRWQQIKHNTLQPQKTGIEPLIQTTYGQGAYYNQYCPVALAGPNGHVPTGCVATAMAQIIRYWEYPERGVGSYTYVANYASSGYGNHGTQSADFGNTTYNYSLMPNYLNSTTTNEQNNEVAKLMYHCGVSVNMMYAANGSGASSASVPSALQNYFAYPSGITYISRSNYTATNWQTIIREELNNLRPVLYDGRSNNSGGHAFVCDGYEGNYFHINWGWEGSYNGNFQLNALNPGGYNFSGNQGAVIGISAADPTIRHIPDKLSISSPVGGYSESKRLEIRGIALTDSISVTASAHFKVGKTSDSLQTQLLLPTQGGTLYVQYTPITTTSTNEEGSIVLTSGNIQDTIILYATAFTPVCNAPTQLISYPVYHGFNLNWTTPETNPEIFTNTLSWDSSFYGSYGYGTDMSYIMLQRYDTNDLAPYKQSFLKAISFIPCADALSYRLVVYQGGSYINNQYFAGEQVVNQEVNISQLNYNNWNAIQLLNPVFVDGTKELWFGLIAYTNGNNGYVLQVGSSTYRAHKGGIVAYASGTYTDSTSYIWTDMASIGIYRNISLKGIFDSFSAHVTEYEIYRNDSLIGITTDTRFSDINMQTDTTEYAVYALWDNFCSASTSIRVLADTNLIPCNITVNMHAEQGNGWNGNRIRIHHRGNIQELSFQYGQDSIATINVYDDLLELEWVTDTPTPCSFSITGPCLYYESPENLTNGIFLSQNISCEAAQISAPNFTYNIFPMCDSSHVSFHYFPMTNDATVTLQYGDGEDSTINLTDPTIESLTFTHNYPLSGTYQVSLSVAKENCDIVRTISKTITINNIYSTPHTDTVYISACDSCIWNNVTHYESGDYLFRYDNSQGCDSLVILHLSLNSSAHTEEYLTLCKNELPYTYADTTFDEDAVSGTLTFHRFTVHGCDSMVTLYLTIFPSAQKDDTIMLCENELPYTYADTAFNEGTVSGSYTFHRFTVHGCDSIANLLLTIYPSVHTEDSVTLYASELPYTYADTVFEAGTTTSSHTFNMFTAEGCDSIVTLHLTITTVSINNYGTIEDKLLNVYPNPANRTVNVKVNDNRITISKAELYDATGRKIKTINWSSDSQIQQIDLEEFAHGLYFIRIYQNKTHLGTLKIIKSE